MTNQTENNNKDTVIEQSLYAKREKVYPREVHGIFANLRLAGVTVLLGLYYLVPWMQWDDRQAVLFDLPARKFYILGMTFWPQDFIYLTLLLILAALSLFFFTALAGRLWCGYACPQTVWTEVFLWIERKVEGSRNKQIKRDKQSWNAEKIRVKATKHGLWLLFAFYTGFTFVGYFTPIRELSQSIVSGSLGSWEMFWVIFYSLATYGNAGWLREQVCTYMCPYARFQSAMIDKDTLVISYDEKRGEPRGGRSKKVDYKEKNLGECVDCSLCVQVCPTGIDIRDGQQYQCIGCAACIDVCDTVMEKMDYPKGLVRYTTLHALDGKKSKVMRSRIIIYAIILMIMATSIGYSMYSRIPLAFDIIRDRNTLYRETDEGLIENVYILKVMNKDKAAHTYELSVSGIEDLQVKRDQAVIHLEGGEINEVVVRLQADPLNLKARSQEVIFELQSSQNSTVVLEEEARFVGPISR